MAKRLHFEEFRTAIVARRMPPGKLADYVRFDPDSAIPKLIFRPNALLDDPPDGYDVDALLCPWSLAIQKARISRQELFFFTGQKRIVAEGDSWFNLPPSNRWPTAIAEWIEKNGRFIIHNIACWGHTMQRMMEDKQYIDEIDERNPHYFIFSGGGNDLQVELESGRLLHDYDPANPTRPVDDYIKDSGKVLNRIEGQYGSLIAEVLGRFGGLRMICYGYDYARPIPGGDQIGRHMERHGIPSHLMQPIMATVMVRLNELIKQAVSSSAYQERALFLPCLNSTEPYTWFDEMHPDSDGFRALASKFEEAMTVRSPLQTA